MPTRKAISAKYQIDNKVLESIMHHLTSLRNICAHHSRLWNRKFTVTLKSPKKPQELVNNFNLNTSQDQERRIYNTLVLLAWFSGIVSPASSWGKKLITLLDSSPNNLIHMGFPPDYKNNPIWKV